MAAAATAAASPGVSASGGRARRSSPGEILLVGGGRYRLGKVLGKGAFGETFEAWDTRRPSHRVAVKLELRTARFPQLAYESRVYQRLQGCEGIPKLYYFGTEGDYNVLVLQRLHSTVEDLLLARGGRLSHLEAACVARQMVRVLESVHRRGIVHRDLKPENFMFETAEPDATLHLIDYGLSKCFIDSRTQQHIPLRTDKTLTGTPRYASLGNHDGLEQSRRDDLESLCYVVVYLMRGTLPWMGLKRQASKRAQYEEIARRKRSTPTAVLCRGLPRELAIMLDYARSLQYDETPDYEWLKRLWDRRTARPSQQQRGGAEQKTAAPRGRVARPR